MKSKAPRATRPYLLTIRPFLAALALFLLLPEVRSQSGPTLAEALNATNLTWTVGGYPWSVQTSTTHDGQAAAMWTRNLFPSEGWLETTVAGPAAVTFWWKVSCCSDDITGLQLYIGGNLQAQISGVVDWQRRSFLVPDGLQTVRWRYTQPSCYVVQGPGSENAGWLDEVSLEEPAVPTILGGPTNQTVLAGEPLVLSVQAAGTEPMAFQWRLFETNLLNATNACLSFSDAQALFAGDYSLLITNPLGVVTSQVATVSVVPRAPAFTLQPSAPPTALGSNVTLSAAAKGTEPIGWQWYGNGIALPDATNRLLVLTNLHTDQAGDYFAIASNEIGATTSQVATLTVVLAPILTQQPASQGAPFGGSADFTAAAYGPEFIGWQWFFNGAPVSGAASSSLSVTNVAVANFGGYSAVATNAYGSATSLVATLSYSPVWAWGAADYGCTQVSAAATNLAAISGGDFHTIALRSNGTVLAWGADYDGQIEVPTGATNIVAIAAAGSHSAALREDGTVVAWGKVHNMYWSGGNLYGSDGDITVPSAATNMVALAGGGGAEHILGLRGDGVPVAWGNTNYALCHIPQAATNIVRVAVGAFHNLALRTDGSVVAWGYNASGQTNVPITATNVVGLAAGQDFSLALRADGSIVAWGAHSSGKTNVPVAASNVVAIACGGDHALASRKDGSVVAWGDNTYGQSFVPAAATNLAAISSHWSGSLGLVGEGIPSISTQPRSGVAMAGDAFRFLADATGALPLSYQWCRDGISLAGMTQPWLVLTDVQSTAGEGYALVVSNAFGIVTSKVARVTAVLPSAPRIASLAQLVVVPTNAAARIAVAALGSEPLSYQWRLSGTNLLNGERISGADAATLVIGGFQAADVGDYTMVITNAVGCVTSSVVTVRFATAQEAVAEAVDATDRTWTITGNAKWFWQATTTHDGEDAAQSGEIPNGTSAQISTTNTGPSAVFFWWKVSSQTNSDYLNFSIDGTGKASVSGEVDWQWRSFAIPYGRHTLAWMYFKHSSVAGGQDCGWVDQVSFGSPALPLLTVAPAGGIVAQNSNFTFTATASGTEPLAYQWQLNGTNLASKTSASLGILNAQFTNAGDYTLVVSNIAGAITSAVAPLVVVPPEALDQPWAGRGADSTLRIYWIVGTLETAERIEGPWSEVTNAISPLPWPAEGSARFFRVRLP